MTINFKTPDIKELKPRILVLGVGGAGGNAINGMIEAGLEIDENKSFKEIISLYEEIGWENQKVFNVFLENSIGYVDNKFLAAGVVAYRRAREANLLAYPNVNKTLIDLTKLGMKLAVVSDAPSREAWMRIYYLNLYQDLIYFLYI